MNIYRRFKKKVFDVVQPASEGNLASKVFDCFIMTLIAISVIGIFAITFNLPRKQVIALEKTEGICIIVFTIEYLLRIWTADLLYPQDSYPKAIMKYMCSGMAIIDILAILPFYLAMFLPFQFLGIRALRLVRMLRIFKLSRYSESLSSIGDVIKDKIKDILASFFVISLLLVMASLLIYYAEHDTQPEQFQNAFSGLWWAVATLTTVGYGDIYPVTVMGRIVGAMIAILGIGMVAIPTGIISSGFMAHLQKQGHKKPGTGDEIQYCPHCGRKIKFRE